MTVKYYPPETKWNLEYPYSDHYYKKYKAELLGWLYTSNSNYYTLGLKDQEADVTPLMLFHRGKTECCFSFEEEYEYKAIKQSDGQFKIIQINIEKFKKRCTKYPWIIMTEGCDDGHIGWMFETKDLAKRWIYYLSITEFKMDDYYEFLHLFKHNQGWVN